MRIGVTFIEQSCCELLEWMNMHLDGWYCFQKARTKSLVLILKRLSCCSDYELFNLIFEYLNLCLIRVYVVKCNFFLHLRELFVKELNHLSALFLFAGGRECKVILKLLDFRFKLSQLFLCWNS